MQPSLAARGVSSLALFGSVARGEARGDSDIDVAIETKGKFGLIALAGVKMYLEECIGAGCRRGVHRGPFATPT